MSWFDSVSSHKVIVHIIVCIHKQAIYSYIMMQHKTVLDIVSATNHLVLIS